MDDLRKRVADELSEKIGQLGEDGSIAELEDELNNYRKVRDE